MIGSLLGNVSFSFSSSPVRQRLWFLFPLLMIAGRFRVAPTLKGRFRASISIATDGNESLEKVRGGNVCYSGTFEVARMCVLTLCVSKIDDVNNSITAPE